MDKTIRRLSILLIMLSVVTAIALGAGSGFGGGSFVTAPNKQVTSLPVTYGLVDEKLNTIPVGSPTTWNNVAIYSFYLPTDAYTNINVRASVSGLNSAGLNFGIDQPNPCSGDVNTIVLYEHPEISQFSVKNIPMQTSKVVYLTRGSHTVYVNVFAWMDKAVSPAYVTPVVISITATNQGNLQIKK